MTKTKANSFAHDQLQNTIYIIQIIFYWIAQKNERSLISHSTNHQYYNNTQLHSFMQDTSILDTIPPSDSPTLTHLSPSTHPHLPLLEQPNQTTNDAPNLAAVDVFEASPPKYQNSYDHTTLELKHDPLIPPSDIQHITPSPIASPILDQNHSDTVQDPALLETSQPHPSAINQDNLCNKQDGTQKQEQKCEIGQREGEEGSEKKSEWFYIGDDDQISDSSDEQQEVNQSSGSSNSQEQEQQQEQELQIEQEDYEQSDSDNEQESDDQYPEDYQDEQDMRLERLFRQSGSELQPHQSDEQFMQSYKNSKETLEMQQQKIKNYQMINGFMPLPLQLQMQKSLVSLNKLNLINKNYLIHLELKGGKKRKDSEQMLGSESQPIQSKDQGNRLDEDQKCASSYRESSNGVRPKRVNFKQNIQLINFKDDDEVNIISQKQQLTELLNQGEKLPTIKKLPVLFQPTLKQPQQPTKIMPNKTGSGKMYLKKQDYNILQAQIKKIQMIELQKRSKNFEEQRFKFQKERQQFQRQMQESKKQFQQYMQQSKKQRLQARQNLQILKQKLNQSINSFNNLKHNDLPLEEGLPQISQSTEITQDHNPPQSGQTLKQEKATQQVQNSKQGQQIYILEGVLKGSQENTNDSNQNCDQPLLYNQTSEG